MVRKSKYQKKLSAPTFTRVGQGKKKNRRRGGWKWR